MEKQPGRTESSEPRKAPGATRSHGPLAGCPSLEAAQGAGSPAARWGSGTALCPPAPAPPGRTQPCRVLPVVLLTQPGQTPRRGAARSSPAPARAPQRTGYRPPGTKSSQAADSSHVHTEHFLLIVLQEPSYPISFQKNAKYSLAIGGRLPSCQQRGSRSERSCQLSASSRAPSTAVCTPPSGLQAIYN